MKILFLSGLKDLTTTTTATTAATFTTMFNYPFCHLTTFFEFRSVLPDNLYYFAVEQVEFEKVKKLFETKAMKTMKMS